MDFDQTSTHIQQGISDKIFPGAAAYIVEDSQVRYYEAFGHRMIKPKIKPMQRETIFDLASLTKPIVVGTLIMRLVENDLLELDASVQSYLREFKHTQVTPLHLLTHTSGLPAWQPVYLEAGASKEFINYLGQMPLEYPTGEKVVYSCLVYILLGKLIEQITGESLDILAREWIFQPLAMAKTRYNPPMTWAKGCASRAAASRTSGAASRARSASTSAATSATPQCAAT